MDEAETLAALDELVDRELVQSAPLPGRFSFRHPIVRRAVYESAKEGWRRSAHARAAAVLSGRGASAATQGTPRRALRPRGRRRGHRHAAAGGLRSQRPGRPRRPPGGSARRCTCSPRGPPRRSAWSCCSRWPSRSAPRDTCRRAAKPSTRRWRCCRRTRPREGAAVAGAAMIDHLLGQHDQAQSLLLESLAELDDRSDEAAALKVALAGGSFFSADWTGMRYWAEEALKVPEQTAACCPPGARRCSRWPTTAWAKSSRRQPRPPRRPRSRMSSPTRSGPGSCSRCARSAGPSTASGACSSPRST